MNRFSFFHWFYRNTGHTTCPTCQVCLMSSPSLENDATPLVSGPEHAPRANSQGRTMHLFFRIPIYLGYCIAIAGFIAHFTGWNFLAVISLDQGMTSAVTGILLSVCYLWLFSKQTIVKREKQE